MKSSESDLHEPSAARPQAEAAPSEGLGRISWLSLGHALNDFYATMLNPVLVELGKRYALSKPQTQMLPALIAIFGSVAQPLAGIFGDRVGRKWLVVAGTLLAAVFMPAIGYAPNLAWLVVLLILGATGVSVFHPNSAAMVAGKASRRGLSLAVFLTGGAVGLALAPYVVTQLVSRTSDLRGLVWLCVPGVALALAFAVTLPSAVATHTSHRQANWHELLGPGSGVLWLLFAVATLRSASFTAFSTFMGHLSEQRGWDITQRGVALSVFLGLMAVGGILGGWLSDWVNRRLLLVLSSAAACPLMMAFAGCQDFAWALFFLVLAGLVGSVATPMIIVLAQGLCPSNQSTASGLMMGLAWGVSGLFLPLIGALAEMDAVQTSGALVVVSASMGVAALLGLFLPSFDHVAPGSPNGHDARTDTHTEG